MSRLLAWLLPWRWLGVVAIGLWGMVMVQLYYHKPGGKALKELYPWAVKEKPFIGVAWMGMFMKGKKIGYSYHETRKDGDGFRIVQRSVMKLQLFGFRQKVTTFSRVWVDKKYRLNRFLFSVKSPVANLSATGEVKGQRLAVILNTAGTKRTLSLQYRPSLLPSAVRAYIASAKLPPGHKVKTLIFDPLSRSYSKSVIEVVRHETIEIDKKKHKALLLKQNFRGLILRAWIDKDGHTLKERSPTGMMLVRQSASQAVKDIEEGFDMIRATQVNFNGKIPDAEKRKSLRLRIRKVSLQAFPDLKLGRQHLKADSLTIQKEDFTKLPRLSFPSKQKRRYAKVSLRLAARATALVQSDHPSIIQQAQKITASSKDRLAAIKALSSWVNKNLQKKIVVGIPSALETLQKKVGDCNEHATLFAALGRAVGIPCHIASGLAYRRGSFFYHAWNECYVGEGKWLSVDATWGQLPADATHIVFVRGGLDKQFSLIQLLNQVSIEAK